MNAVEPGRRKKIVLKRANAAESASNDEREGSAKSGNGRTCEFETLVLANEDNSNNMVLPDGTKVRAMQL